MVPYPSEVPSMKNRRLAAPAILLCAAACVYAQAAGPSPQQADQAAAAQNAAQRRQIQQELQSLQQRLAARYAGDLSSEEIQQRMQQLQQQLQQLGPTPAFGAGGRGLGAGRGGRGGPITPPADATSEQLRQIVDQQNQQITRLQAALQPARPAAPQPCVPVNPNATEEAKNLLQRICDITGTGILTGQHNFPNQRNRDTEAIHATTGKYPAIWGSDFGFTNLEDQDAVTHRDLMIEEAKRQYAAGSIIYLCWHMLRPTEDEPGQPGASWGGSVQAKLTDDQWLELITSDSPLHQRWEQYMDTAAGYLKQLQDAHIPVLWRPMHENNGTFFWWGGRPGQYGTAQLFREVYNRMVNVHHLNNLVWVWNQNGPAPGGEFYSFYPGAKYADIVSYDNYSALDGRYYHEILTIANGKPIGLGEVGSPPPPELLMAQPKWAFYMTWAGMTGTGPAPGGPGGAGAASVETAAPIAVPDDATQQQLREMIQQLRQQPGGGRGGRSPAVYPIPEGAGTDMLRRIVQRLQPGPGNALKAIYEDPYYIKRGDPMPK
jgi:mannan endo-1,4-beta-mannosidase